MKKYLFISFLFPMLVFGEMQNFPGGVHIPEMWDGLTGSISLNATTIDADDEAVAFIFQIPKTGNVRRAHFRTGTVVTGGNLATRLETIDNSTGTPSGNLFCANASTYTVISSTQDNAWINGFPFEATCAVTRGNIAAVVLRREVGSTFNGGIVRNSDYVNNFSYAATSTTSSGWVKILTGGPVQLEYDDGTYSFSPSVIPVSAFAFASLTNTSSPREIGMRISLPFRASVLGAWLDVGSADNTASFNLLAYDSDGVTVMSSSTIYMANSVGTTIATQQYIFPESIIFEANTYYRVVVKGNSTSSVSINDYTVDTDALMASTPFGAALHLSSATTVSSEASWTNFTTRKPVMGIILDGIDADPAAVKIYQSTIHNGTFQ